MSRIIAVEYLTLDGVMEEPSWSGPYFDDDLGTFQNDNLEETDALLLGRVTYEGFKEAWPGMVEETGEFGVKMNSMPKFVATTTLSEPEWNASFIEGDVAEAVAELKARPNNNMMVAGSGVFFEYLRKHNLIDEYRIMVFPVVVGTGKRLFTDAETSSTLKLVKSQNSGSGVAILTYVPAE